MKLHCLARRIAISGVVAMSICGVSAHADTLFAADNVSASLNGVVMFNPVTLGVTGTFITSGPISGLATNSESHVFASIGSGVFDFDTSMI